MSELKPCPFCGSPDVRPIQYAVSQGTHSHKEWQVECRNCGACGPNDLGKSGAIQMWNMRRTQFPSYVPPVPADTDAQPKRKKGEQ